jgi:hypothetical protein
MLSWRRRTEDSSKSAGDVMLMTHQSAAVLGGCQGCTGRHSAENGEVRQSIKREHKSTDFLGRKSAGWLSSGISTCSSVCWCDSDSWDDWDD